LESKFRGGIKCVQNDNFLAVRCHAFVFIIQNVVDQYTIALKLTVATSVFSEKLYKYYLSVQRSSALFTVSFSKKKNVTVLSITRNDRRKRYAWFEYEKNIKI